MLKKRKRYSIKIKDRDNNKTHSFESDDIDIMNETYQWSRTSRTYCDLKLIEEKR